MAPKPPHEFEDTIFVRADEEGAKHARTDV
jgi:hypothetical protein